MKYIYIFLAGAVAGVIAILVYQTRVSSDQIMITAPDPAVAALTPPCVAVAPREKPAPNLAEHPTVPVSPSASATISPPAEEPLLIPVFGVVASQLNDTFNDTRDTKRQHEAIDIMAQKGTLVWAVADGKVAKLFNSKPGGLTVYHFDKTEKFAYYYAHLDRYAIGVKDGMVLKRGDLLGYVGSTGNADPKAPHLHFAIFELGPEKQWWKGRAINPYPLLGGAKHL